MEKQNRHPTRSLFTTLGTLAISRPWLVLGIWAAILLLAIPASRQAPALLFNGSGDIPDSPSNHVDSLLNADFPNPFSHSLVLALSVSDEARNRALEKALKALPEVSEIMIPENMLDKRLSALPGTGDMILIGLKADNIRLAEKAIPAVRGAVTEALRPWLAADSALEWAVTGRAALSYDMNRYNSRDSARAELRALPLTLIILLFAFGSLVAAGVPILLGVATTTISMGIIYLLAARFTFSNLVENMASMIGLAVGIDYSLLLIHRYRELLALSPATAERADMPDRAGEKSRRGRALVEAMATAGKAVFYSGLTVMIGLLGMVFTPLTELRSMGWGGSLVVLISVAAALTLLPALLTVLGPWLDWPRALSQRLAGLSSSGRWERWSRSVLRRAPLCLLVGLAAIFCISWPGRLTRFGFPEGPFIPAEIEFSRGYRMLDSMGLQGIVSPLQIVLTDTSGGKALAADRIPGLFALSQRLRADSGVERLFGPVDLADGWPLEKYLRFYADIDAALEQVPMLGDLFLSRDGRSLLMQASLRQERGLEDAKRIAREMPGWSESRGLPGMKMFLGGQPVYYNDFDKAMLSAYGPTCAFVLIVSGIALMLFFRSPLLAAKALVMNTLSVAAGYGAVVYVFQLGHGAALFGVGMPTGVVPMTIPLTLFCMLFGLSMDYEVFLISRMREEYLKTGSNDEAVVRGLAATGPVITSAALVMVAVFGAFAFGKVIMVQMLGLGLAVAVLVDATIIRILLVPAFMKVAGRWNWWPDGTGSKRR